MNPSNTTVEDKVSLEDVINILHRAAQLMWLKRKLIARRVGLASIIGIFIAFGSPVEYSARMLLLPNRGGGAGSTGLTGLAGLAGLRLPSTATDQAIAADLYPEIAKSLDFRIAVAEAPLRFSTHYQPASSIEYFSNIRKPAVTEILYSYTLGLPYRLLSEETRTENSDSKRNSLAPRTYAESTEVRQYEPSYLSLVKTVGQRISVTFDKKTSILLISAKMPDPQAAAYLVQVSANKLMQRITEYESQKSEENFRFVNKQYQQARTRYESAHRDLAIFTDRNRILMSATSQIDRDKLQREYDIAFEVYQQLSRDLEQARIKMTQDTPVFTILDKVTVPNTRTEPNRTIIILLSLFLGALAGVAQIGLAHILRRNESNQGEQ
jgi:uncharacterized protein involved in exopolysaccharide biosynthesis